VRPRLEIMNAVEVHSLHFTYPDGITALHDVSLTVADGECVGLIGPNGAGKTTLLLHLNGLLPDRPATESAVRVFQTPVTAAHLDQIRRSVGILFQNPDDQLFCPTVFEDVAFGPEQFGLDATDLRDRVARALETVGLKGFESRSPQHLSFGQKRRVCLAGILACEPKVLVLDEPTSGLDPRGRRELRAILHALPIPKLIASHDLELIVELCHRVILLDDGRVVVAGPARELLNDESLMLAHGLERPHILRHLHPHS
jgi:energy-coupling factor transporter ATP-binding protein EcfA2